MAVVFYDGYKSRFYQYIQLLLLKEANFEMEMIRISQLVLWNFVQK